MAPETWGDRNRAQGKKHNAALVCLARRRIDVLRASIAGTAAVLDLVLLVLGRFAAFRLDRNINRLVVSRFAAGGAVIRSFCQPNWVTVKDDGELSETIKQNCFVYGSAWATFQAIL